jgi:hypothetical protein
MAKLAIGLVESETAARLLFELRPIPLLNV